MAISNGKQPALHTEVHAARKLGGYGQVSVTEIAAFYGVSGTTSDGYGSVESNKFAKVH